MDVPIFRYESIGELAVDLDRPARYIVEDPGYSLPLDMLFIPRPSSSRLLVGFHGAEARAKADLPHYQFVRSFMSRSESLLFMSDSTLLQSERLSLGWFAGNQNTPLAERATEAVKKVASATPVRETVLVGHSGGGFAAMLVGSGISNSHAISVNGQTVISRHRKWSITALRTECFPELENNEEMLSEYGHRLDLRVALQKREQTSSFTYFAHEDDRLSMTEHPHFPLLADYYGVDNRTGGFTHQGDALVLCRWTSANPSTHALPGGILPFIELALGESEPRVRIERSFHPSWPDNSGVKAPR